jgi:ATP-dependent RNA helicase DDX60
MSFVPAPQQANVASANKSSNNEVAVKSNTAAAAAAEDPVNEDELIFKIRTFDVYWVDKYALMYKAGVDKVCYNYLLYSIL